MRRGFLNTAPKAPPRSDNEEEVPSSPSPPAFLNMHLDDDQHIQAQTPPSPLLQINDKEDPPPTTAALEDDPNWAVDRATSLPEVWALVAKYRGVLGARRLMRVCKAARVGATEFLRTLPGLVVCGGQGDGGIVSDVWRLDLATMQWEPMPALVAARSHHACCAVRGALVVLGGETVGGGLALTSSVEILSGRGVCGSPATVMRRDSWCSCDRGGGER
jgi:hypothetical protein